MTSTLNPKLAPIYAFFEEYGTERLNGLDPSNFLAFNESEKEEVWNFLSDRFARSAERINALYNLDPKRAVAAFNRALKKECTPSDFVARNANFSGWNPHSA